MKLFLYLLTTWFSIFSKYVMAQKTTSDFISNDSLYKQGKVVPLKNGEVLFQATKRDKPVIYSAYKIKEYSYHGRIYESLNIDGNQKYFEKIVSGKASFYQEKKMHFLKIDSAIIVFDKKNFRSVFKSALNCDGKDQILTKLDFSKGSLSYFINSYNQDYCNSDKLLYKKFGVYVGYNQLQFNAFFTFSDDAYKLRSNASSPMIGLFYDSPLHRPRSLIFTLGLDWFYAKTQFYNENGYNTTFSKVTFNGVSSYFSIKWILVKKGIKPYTKVGGLISFLTISPAEWITTSSNPDGSVINMSKQSLTKSNALLYGFDSGIGFELPYRYRKNFHIELKYNKTAEGNFNYFSMYYSRLLIAAGFNL